MLLFLIPSCYRITALFCSDKSESRAGLLLAAVWEDALQRPAALSARSTGPTALAKVQPGYQPRLGPKGMPER